MPESPESEAPPCGPCGAGLAATSQTSNLIDEEVSHIRKLWELWDASPPSPNAPTPPMGECWNCALWPRAARPPPGVKEGSRAGFIRNSPKTYRRIDSIEGHRLPLDAHMTGGEGRRPGARGCGCGCPSCYLLGSCHGSCGIVFCCILIFSQFSEAPYTHHGIVYDVRNRRGRRGPAPAPRCARATGREKASL